jgi:hypothetical protein
VALAVRHDLSAYVLGAALAALIVFAVANRRIEGIAVVALGLGLNLAAVVVNAGMPVAEDAAVVAGLMEPGQRVSVGSGRHLERPEDPAVWAGDIVPVRWAGLVVSFGDLLVATGIGATTAELTRRRARAHQSVASGNVAQVWGTAPKPSPVAASQYSAKPLAATADHIDLRTPAATDDAPDLVASSHAR